jgi:cytoskeletal protein CcmA (bactofilin family)
MFNSKSNRKNVEPASESPAEQPKVAAAVEKAIATSVRLNELKPSIISEGFSFTGDIVSEGALHIEGQLKGTIRVSAATIGAKGTMDGTIDCSSLQIKGAFEGNATCDELLIDSTASVRGKVRYKVLTAQRGASILGELTVSE